MSISLEDLAARVTVLEKAQSTNAATMKWMAGTLGQIQAAVDDHTGRLDGIDKRLDSVDRRLGGIDKRLDSVEGRLERVEYEIKNLRTDMPGIVAAALRDVLKPG